MTSASATERFGKTADDYERFRPGYPLELVAWVTATCGTPAEGSVVDLGSGTGIASRLFGGQGFPVVGVEPNEAMRERAEHGGGATYVKGTAEATGRPARSADLVIAAQAFHWFALEPTFQELGRILKPHGAACAFWNVRRSTAILRDYDTALARFVTNYGERPQAETTIHAIASAPRATVLGQTELANVQQLDREGLLGRARSSSYVAHDATDLAALERALGEVFARHARGGVVDFAYRTLAIAWRVSTAR